MKQFSKYLCPLSPFWFVCFLFYSCGISTRNNSAVISGEYRQWHKLTLTFEGPETGEEDQINPFLDYRMTVTFTNEKQKIVVPGYYAADGNAANSGAGEGNKWRCHFIPSETGKWTWSVSFRTGSNIVINDNPLTGEACFFDGQEGSFDITGSDKEIPDFRSKGLLKYTGGHYFQFAGTKEYYLKGGADSPENFLAYKEIDNTYDADAGSGSYEHIGGFIHEYHPHINDWNSGDPTWKDDKGKGIIGALNYLAEKEMNSVYFLTYNMDGGDGRDTWMWTDENERKRYDCSKLDQWEIIFDHMDRKGLMLHVVTQETENDHNLGGSAGLNLVRKLYYRELIARFSHHLALIWNLGEENNTPDADRKDIAAYIRSQDPYDHPITVHTHHKTALEFYDGILGNENFEASSIQSDMALYHNEAIVLRQRSEGAGRKWVIFADEQGPASHGVVPDADDPAHDIPRKYGLWGNLMGGGSGVEWYFGHQYAHMDINCEDWRSRDLMWDQTRIALKFFHTYLPFWEMLPADQLISSKENYCFANEGEVYAIYLLNCGKTNLDLGNSNSEFEVKWFNPRTGGELQYGSLKTIKGGDWQAVGNPPEDPDKDWAVLIKKKE
jgi:hypothetical protein